jgi:hypothetical protein
MRYTAPKHNRTLADALDADRTPAQGRDGRRNTCSAQQVVLFP